MSSQKLLLVNYTIKLLNILVSDRDSDIHAIHVMHILLKHADDLYVLFGDVGFQAVEHL